MDIKPLPTSVLAVEAWLREMMPPAVAAQLDTPYPFLFGMATAKLAETHVEYLRLVRKQATMQAALDALGNVHDFLDDQSDVIDGDDGPLPNRAMSLLRDVEAAIAKAEGRA